MASRLHLKIGVVAERDRLSSSADSILVTEPSTGSRARSKGNLYLIVTARTDGGGRPRDAAALVAETLRRDYYYDESAGIPVCLEKAVRSANRRLRHQREGHGLPPGAIGASIAVIRGNELYLTTIGDGDAYLVRHARLLVPEHHASGGIPAADGMRIDVWRGEFALGDTLVLASRTLTDVLGTEEIKNAVVTLHPQSAVEHLHHLFLASSGQGSDALLAIEATESSMSRGEQRLVPAAAAEPVLAGAFDRGGVRDPLGGAAHAIQGGAGRAEAAIGNAFAGVADRIIDLLPQRRAKFRPVRPPATRRDSQRRYALTLLMLIAFISIAGGLAYALSVIRPTDRPITAVNAADAAFADARGRLDRALGAGDIPVGDEASATKLLRDAWRSLDQAKAAGVPDTRIAPLRARAATGLDVVYRTRHTNATPIVRFADALPGADPRDLVMGPPQDPGAVYFIDRASDSVVRIELASGRAAIVIKAGDGAGGGIGQPAQLGAGGPDVLVIDARGDLWRWRPSDTGGRGTLSQYPVGGDTKWGADVADFATFLVNSDSGLYNLYVVDPAADQILRYQPTADGGGFSQPSDYLAAASSEGVKSFRGLLIDGDVYALAPDAVLRHESGRRTDFALAALPDASDLRPTHEYQLFAASGARRTGKLYLWDRLNDRIIVFGKNGGYLEQFVARPPTPPFQDLRGIVIQEQGEGVAPNLYWLTPTALYVSPLQDAGATAPSAGSSGGVGASPAGPSGETSPSGGPSRTPRSTSTP